MAATEERKVGEREEQERGKHVREEATPVK
jgi:hypothetical protein